MSAVVQTVLTFLSTTSSSPDRVRSFMKLTLTSDSRILDNEY